jgi:hypothetical protein
MNQRSINITKTKYSLDGKRCIIFGAETKSDEFKYISLGKIRVSWKFGNVKLSSKEAGAEDEEASIPAL